MVLLQLYSPCATIPQKQLARSLQQLHPALRLFHPSLHRLSFCGMPDSSFHDAALALLGRKCAHISPP